MRIFHFALPLVVLLGCQASARVGTEPNPSNGPATSPPPPTATPAAAVKPPRPTTKQGCDACNGLWQRHGISETESCICKTKDSGKVCRDGAECEGTCLVTGDAKFEVANPGPPPRGSFSGKCSEYDTTFGCIRMIPNGTRAKGPLPEEEAAHRICVD